MDVGFSDRNTLDLLQAVETNKYVFKIPMPIKRLLAATVFKFTSKILQVSIL
jgi:hypothetical protein